MLAVVCNVAFTVLISGRPNTLVVADVQGYIVAEHGDSLLVDFSLQRPTGYRYLDAPIKSVKENDCLYIK